MGGPNGPGTLCTTCRMVWLEEMNRVKQLKLQVPKEVDRQQETPPGQPQHQGSQHHGNDPSSIQLQSSPTFHSNLPSHLQQGHELQARQDQGQSSHQLNRGRDSELPSTEQ
jgi:hypothetical protein